jgi:heat-inducible transcriptional repressor
MLSPRAETILKSIVAKYIERAVPVPSQSIASDPELGVSPATVRNEMARLEQEGYITRAHPSAGSIPSDKGYRYYVESLKDVSLADSEQRLISHLFHQVEKELENWLSLAAMLLARQVQNVAVVTMPKPTDCRFKHLELVALQGSLALVVLVLHGVKVRQQLIIFDQAVAQPELTATANKLSATFAGLTRRQISAKALDLSPVEQQVTALVQKMMQAEDEQEYEAPYLDGWHFMLNQPEFTHSHRMLGLMELIDQRSLLKNIIPQGLESHRVQVIIGKENKEEAFHDYSIVISKYGVPDEAVGTLGVLGPTRMPYAHAISTVGYLAWVLSKLVAGLYGKEPPEQEPKKCDQMEN